MKSRRWLTVTTVLLAMSSSILIADEGRPAATAQQSSTRLIEPADIIRVSVFLRGPDPCGFRPTKELYVHPDGTIQMRSGLAIYVAGLTWVQAAENVRQCLCEHYHRSLHEVSVEVGPSLPCKQEVWLVIRSLHGGATNRVPIQDGLTAQGMLRSAKKLILVNLQECNVWIQRPTEEGYEVIEITDSGPASNQVLRVDDRVQVCEKSPLDGGGCVCTSWSPMALLPDSIKWAMGFLILKTPYRFSESPVELDQEIAEPKSKLDADARMFPAGNYLDFGTVKRGPILKQGFRIVNTSDFPLSITRWRVPACPGPAHGGSVSKDVLQPNEEGILNVQVDTRRFVGPRTGTCFLTVERGGAFEEFRFTITVNVVEGE